MSVSCFAETRFRGRSGGGRNFLIETLYKSATLAEVFHQLSLLKSLHHLIKSFPLKDFFQGLLGKASERDISLFI